MQQFSTSGNSPEQTSSSGSSDMKVWNVRLSVVELINADTAEDAITALRSKVRAAGLDVYEVDAGDAFESEDVN